jgi:hypothetical protein
MIATPLSAGGKYNIDYAAIGGAAIRLFKLIFRRL